MANLVDQMNVALSRSVPLVAITTPDPWATITAVAAGTSPEIAKLQFDVVRGITAINKPGNEALGGIQDDDNAGGFAGRKDPFDALVAAARLPARSLLFIHLADKWLRDDAIVQAVWNLRNEFKNDHRMLVLLSRSGHVPVELSDDVMTFDEPLPTGDELAAIVREQHESVGLECDDAKQALAVEALRGLSAFAAEQSTAVSFGSKKEGLKIDALWDRKRQQVEQTPGLQIFRGGDKFDAIGGCEVVKQFLSRVVQGAGRPNAIVFIDEIEKAMGGAKGDMSGVAQDQLGSLLSYMQDNASAGVIFIGPPGAAKSAIAKSAGNEAGIPTIQLDLGAMKGSLVGQSEHQLRAALKRITAVSNGKALFIATCNSIAELPPELRRRFTLGTFFFDLPSKEERLAIWKIWGERYGIPNEKDEITAADLADLNDEGWTGAEIRQCCDIAWRLEWPLGDAAAFVVPVSKSAGDMIRRLREQASGKFLSASYPGVFEADRKNVSQRGSEKSLPKKRALKLDD